MSSGQIIFSQIFGDFWAIRRCEGNVAWGVALGAISTAVSFVFLVMPRLPFRWVAALILFPMWVVGVGVLTFDSPFRVTSNGYFGSWVAFFSSVIWFFVELSLQFPALKGKARAAVASWIHAANRINCGVKKSVKILICFGMERISKTIGDYELQKCPFVLRFDFYLKLSVGQSDQVHSQKWSSVETWKRIRWLPSRSDVCLIFEWPIEIIHKGNWERENRREEHESPSSTRNRDNARDQAPQRCSHWRGLIVSPLTQLSNAKTIPTNKVMSTAARIYIVMEYVPKGDLLDRIEELGHIPEQVQFFSILDFFLCVAIRHGRVLFFRWRWDISPAC